MFNATLLHKNTYSNDIDKVYNDILKNIFCIIKDTNINHQNNIIYELPFYFESLISLIDKNIINIDKLRIIIWGKIIECLKAQNFTAVIDIQNNCEKCFLYISWSTSLDVYSKSFNKYNDIIQKNKHIHCG
tara:strand:- start:8998 stop:9390 length:393 start_codon:yes stop_codon:yes gene_type:complete